MRKLLALIVFTSSLAHAGPEYDGFTPVSISSSGTKLGGGSQIAVNFNYPGAGNRNCITDVAVSASGFPATGYTFYILDGGATSYALNVTTGPIIESWYPRNPLCLSLNTTTYMWIDQTTGTFKLNATGYQRER